MIYLGLYSHCGNISVSLSRLPYSPSTCCTTLYSLRIAKDRAPFYWLLFNRYVRHNRSAHTPTLVAFLHPLSRSLQRALGWVGWGLNRVALGRENVQSDMLYIDNLVRLPRESLLPCSCIMVWVKPLACHLLVPDAVAVGCGSLRHDLSWVCSRAECSDGRPSPRGLVSHSTAYATAFLTLHFTLL